MVRPSFSVAIVPLHGGESPVRAGAPPPWAGAPPVVECEREAPTAVVEGQDLAEPPAAPTYPPGFVGALPPAGDERATAGRVQPADVGEAGVGVVP